MWNDPCGRVQHHKICLPSLFSTKPLLSSSSRHIYPLYGTYFCVYCLYEAVDTMPSPEFRRSFPIGKTIFVLTFQMRSVVPSQNIIQSQQGYENCLPAFKLLLSMAYGTPDFQHSIRKAATKRWRLTISTNVRAPSKHTAQLRTVNLLFMAYGTQDFQHSIRTAARKRRQLTTVRANCLWTANLLFVEVTHLGHQNQKELMQ